MRKHLLGLLAATCSSAALAGTPGWRISEASGPVQISHAGITQIAVRRAALSPGDTVSTGAGGRAVLVRGSEFIMVAPASRVQLPADDATTGFTRVMQDVGNVVFMIKKKIAPHFEVKTPYLAAVVKGTTFTVAVTPGGASVQVLEGAVDVATPDGGAHDLLKPGGVALVGAADHFRLQIEGPSGRSVIDSPARDRGQSVRTGETPRPSSLSGPVAPSPVPSDAPSPAPFITPSAPIQAVETVVYTTPVSVAESTGGLVSGTITSGAAADVADVAKVTATIREATTATIKAVELVQTAACSVD